MHSQEQERWENILGRVKKEGKKIRRRRAVISVSATIVTAVAIVFSVLMVPASKNSETDLLMAQQAELEVMMISNDVIDENLGVF